MSRNRKYKTTLALACLVLGGAALAQAPAPAVPLPPGAARQPVHTAAVAKGPTANLTFKNAPIDIVLQYYSDNTGRTLLQAPNLPKVNITLESQTPLTLEERLQAIDSVLAMNGVSLLKIGDKFLKVVDIKTALTEEMESRDESQGPPQAKSELVSQMIQLQYVTIAEAQQAITPLKHSYAQVTPFDRINSILLTDTSGNVNRIMQILKYVDQPTEAKEEPNIIEIHYANVSDIKKKLEDVIADQQKDAEKSTVPRSKPSGSPGVVTTPTVPGVIRATPSSVTRTAQPDELVAAAEKGIILGKVKIIADERTNILIIITRHENMGFFDKIIKVLDVPTAPDVIVKIIRLQYANAEKTAATLNSLIGGKSPDKPKDTTAKPGAPGEQGKSAALNEYVQKLENPTTPAAGNVKSKVGELSAANIKILSDDRTNALLLMASKGDMAAIEEMVKDMDIMLSQVMIEVVILQVNLTKNDQRGIDVVQRALMVYEKDSSGGKKAILSGGGGVSGDTSVSGPLQDPLTLTTIGSLASAGNNLTYYLSLYNLNLDAVIKLVENEGNNKVMASPQILTLDNKPATINLSGQVYLNSGFSTSTGPSGATISTPNMTLKEMGTKLVVTPHINEKKYVVLEIEQTFQRRGADQPVPVPNPNGTGYETVSFATVNSDDFNASVAVRSGETIMLGGMIGTTKNIAESKVPILGDIPIIGNLFKSKTEENDRDETIVFITPYVLNSPEEIERETARIRNSVDVEGMWPKGWSRSTLADDKKHDYATKRQERELAEQADKESKRLEKEAARAKAAAEKQVATDKKSGSVGKGQQADQKAQTQGESAKKAVPASVSPAGQVDPAMEQFIERQEKRWDNELKDLDQSAVKAPAGQP